MFMKYCFNMAGYKIVWVYNLKFVFVSAYMKTERLKMLADY